MMDCSDTILTHGKISSVTFVVIYRSIILLLMTIVLVGLVHVGETANQAPFVSNVVVK